MEAFSAAHRFGVLHRDPPRDMCVIPRLVFRRWCCHRNSASTVDKSVDEHRESLWGRSENSWTAETGHNRCTGEPGTCLRGSTAPKALQVLRDPDLSTENRGLYSSLSFKFKEIQKNKTSGGGKRPGCPRKGPLPCGEGSVVCREGRCTVRIMLRMQPVQEGPLRAGVQASSE